MTSSDNQPSTEHDLDGVVCPACETRFRCQLTQLALAEGLLRCGVCQQVFNALPQLSQAQRQQLRQLSEPQLAEPKAAPAAEPTIDTAPATESETAGPRRGQELLEGLNTVDHGFEFHRAPQRRRWPWLLLNFTAILLLFSQLAYWQRDRLLDEPRLPSGARQTLQRLCQQYLNDCAGETSSPSMEQSRDIVSQKLLVRPHPEASGALQVDAILLNRSDSSRDFPLLRLRFSNIHGDEIASRLFQPSEYLAGELNALSQLQSRQPVHIALEIVDPGSAAVNYQLELFSHR